jgi:FixJ family two-component response regulator
MTLATYVAIVDDDESLCRSLSRLLLQAGLHSMAFNSGEEFLSSSLHSKFGCLLVDVQLGGMTGTELHQKLVEKGVRTPVIYITAHDENEEVRPTECAGYFKKSVDGATLLDAIRRVLPSPIPGNP